MLTMGRRIIGDSYLPADLHASSYPKSSNVRELNLCTDLENINASSYDLILHNHVLEHVACAPASVLSELHRLLAPGGWQVFSIPIFPSRINEEDLSPSLTADERRLRFGQSDHMRAFGKNYMDILNAAGLELFDIGEIIRPEELTTWAVPADSLFTASSHRIFASQK
jgi:phosphoglycolate phosphatase